MNLTLLEREADFHDKVPLFDATKQNPNSINHLITITARYTVLEQKADSRIHDR